MSALETLKRTQGLVGPPAGALADGRSRRRGFLNARSMFACIVLLPTLLAAIYFGFVASDRFVSESRFIVRSASTPQVGGLASFLRTFGVNRADDDAFAVQSYILSRDALRELSEILPMREILDRDESDLLSRCLRPWSSPSFERLYRCYLSRVRIFREDETGISRLTVDLFTPDDSNAVSRELLGLGERLANRMNERAEADALTHASALLDQAEARVIAAQAELTAFRNRELLIDIEGSSGQANAVISRLLVELAQTRAAIDQQQRVSPGSPQTASLIVRASVLEEQIREQRSLLTGGEGALVNQIGDYEGLVLRRNLADEALAVASNAIDQARQEARRQSIYVETVVAPNLADQATRPERLRNILTVLLCALFVYGIVTIVTLGFREHLDREA